MSGSDEEVEFIDDEDAAEVQMDDNQSSENGLNAEFDDLEVGEAIELVEEEGRGEEATKDDSMVCFTEHKGSVFSVSVSPSGELVCSGGEDDRALVWRTADGTVLFTCDGHQDSVSCTGFSSDGKYLATGDMGGLIQVWTVTDGKKVWSFETGDLEWVQWHPGAHVLLAGTSSGDGWIWKIPSWEYKTFQGHNCRNTCAAVLKTGKSACFGYDDGSVKVWDLKEATTLLSVTGPTAHTGPVTCMSAHTDGNLLLTGSADATAKLVNVSSGKVVATFEAGFPRSQGASSSSPSTDEEERETVCVEVVDFSSSLPLAVTGSLSGVLGVWDMPTQQLRLKCDHKAGIVRTHCSSQSPLVYTASLDGCLRRWDLRTGQCVGEWEGHTDHILDMTVTSDEKFIVSGSDDQTARVFSTA